MTQTTDPVKKLSELVRTTEMPADLRESILVRLSQVAALSGSDTFLSEFDRINKYVEWILALPWEKRTKDVLDLNYTKEVLDKYHFGLEDIKNRILEYVSIMKLKVEKGEGDDVLRAPILCFVGLVGTGKTTIAKSIAESMGRNFARIPFGGMGDPLDLRGQSKMHPEAEPGKIIKALRDTGAKNSVILLDEIDRVTAEGRASIMGVLVELLDPEQNKSFVDHYIDYPVDLSEILFVATANNTNNLATAVLDRLEPIQMPSYTDEEKIAIGKKYMLPKIIKQSGISPDAIVIEDEVWSSVVRPLGFDAGMRTLQRTVQGLVRKVAKLIVEGKATQVTVNPQNVKEFLPQ
jgi:ATP-dependent Lon protease